MARFPVTASGVVEDPVRLDLAGQTLAIVEQYEVRQGFFTKPDAFAITIGSGETALPLIRRFPARTDYALYIGDVLQQTGRTDGYTVSDGSGATTLQIRGRDLLAPLLDSDAEADRSFSDMTYVQIVAEVMTACGVTEFELYPDNAANCKAQAAVPVSAGVSGATAAQLRATAVSAELKRIYDKQTAETKALLAGQEVKAIAQVRPGQSTQIIRQGVTVVDTPNAVPDQGAQAPTPAKDKPLKIRAGENYFTWLKDLLHRAGLFLFAAAGAVGSGATYVLAQPNTAQKPTYRLRRQRGGGSGGDTAQADQAAAQANAVNVISVRHKNETTSRAARYVVLGRAGSGHKGRSTVSGEFIDEEMVAFGFPLTQVRIKADSKAKNEAQAAHEARFLCAEARRGAWEYVATVQGHSAPSLLRPDERAIWTVDTIVEVLDDELGIRENLWIADVAYRRGPNGTTCELSLMRPADMVYEVADYD